MSSASVYNVLLERRPDLIDHLYRQIPLDTRGDGGVDFIPVVPCQYADGRLRTFYHSDYYRSAAKYPNAPRLDPTALELLDLYDEIANGDDMSLEMDLRPGDIQLVCNHAILHGRTAYQDSESQRRHLLRLWLSVPHTDRFATRLRTEVSRWRILARLAGIKLRSQRS